MSTWLRIAALVVLALILRGLNTSRDARDRHWWSPLLVLLYAAAMLWLASRLPDALAIQAWFDNLQLEQVFPPDVVESIGTVLVELASYLPIVALALYIPIKALGRVLARLTRERPATLASGFYVPSDQGTALRPHWWFTHVIVGVSSLLAVTLLMLYATPLADRWSLAPASGSELAAPLVFLLLSELTYFLGGRLLAAIPSFQAAQQEPARDPPDLARIASLTRERWVPRLLSEGMITRELMPPHEKNEGPCAGLEIEGWSDSWCSLLDELLAGESVMIEGVLPYEVEPCLRAYLHDRLVRGERALLLVPRLDHVKVGQSWLQRVLPDHDWTVLGHGNALAERTDIVVATPYQGLFRLLEEPWASDLSIVLIPDAQALAWQAAELRAFLRAAMVKTRKGRVQVIAFSDRRVNNEEMLRNRFGIPGQNRELGKPAAQAHYLAFATEGNEPFHNGIFTSINARPSEETCLAVPAVYEGAQPRLAGGAAQPLVESLNEINNSAEAGQLERRFPGAQLPTSGLLPGADWALRPDPDAPTIIARDALYNLPATLRRMLPSADRPGLVEVISPPYLLRAHFTRDIEWQKQLAQPRRFTALAPGAMATAWAVAHGLFRRLEQGWVPLPIVQRELANANLTPQTSAPLEATEEALRILFETHFDQPSMVLRWRRTTQFDPAAKDFLEVDELTMGEGQRQRRPPWMEIIPIMGREQVGGEPMVLEYLPYGHAYQLYLPGQVHAFDGRPYRIDSITPRGVQGSFVNTREWDGRYRQLRTAEVNWEQATILQQREDDPPDQAYHLTIERIAAPVVLSTRGYLAWRPWEGADSGVAREKLVEVPERRYPSGKLLRLTLTPGGADASTSIEGSDALAVLISEALWSYFPEARPFIQVLAPGDGESLGRRDASVAPVAGGTKPGSVSVVLVEDSRFDLGLLSALWMSADNVLADLAGVVEATVRDGSGCEPWLTHEEAGFLVNLFRGTGPDQTLPRGSR